MMDWLLISLSGAPAHDIAPWAFWHARVMVLGWGVLLPLGALLARFYKVTPQQDWPRQVDSKVWWHGHRTLQYAGVACVTLGVYLAWGQGSGASPTAQWHGWAGWALLVAGWSQVIGSFFRGSKGGPTDTQVRGDHYDMTARRLAFEALHKSIGWLALVVSIATLVLGLVIADAPRWMLLMLIVWWLLLAAAFYALQKNGRCIDTYQAIWGPDPAHPGNRRSLPGWGVRRPLDGRQSR